MEKRGSELLKKNESKYSEFFIFKKNISQGDNHINFDHNLGDESFFWIVADSRADFKNIATDHNG
ncbi:MAG: hypothetical protein WC465_03225 [Patescibacteria group bacterium]|jgi:hypothetical protein